jgi:hypothetical protein
MLVIEDDGCGLPPGSGQQGFGLTGMRERVTDWGTLSSPAPTALAFASPAAALYWRAGGGWGSKSRLLGRLPDKRRWTSATGYWRRHILLPAAGLCAVLLHPQMLIAAVPECSHKEAAQRHRLWRLFAYLGHRSPAPLAQVMEIWHWSGFFVVIAIAAGISALLLLPFLNAQAPREA